MRMTRVGEQLEVCAPAKLNLFLEVTNRRSDGFHEIETLMVPISLVDTLRFKASDHDQFSVRLSPALRQTNTKCPTGPENLVLRAVNLLRDTYGVNRCAAIQLIKRIPSEAGMGGGSSDAAAAMVAANQAWGLGLSYSRLAELSAKLGSDIPFFFSEGSAICRGRGELVESTVVCQFYAVIVKPPQGLATKDVYQRVDLRSPRMKIGFSENQENLSGFSQKLFNRLEAAAESISPNIEKLRTIFDGLGVLGHQLSGSGSSYFGICRSARHARCIAARLKALRLGMVFAVRTQTPRAIQFRMAQS